MSLGIKRRECLGDILKPRLYVYPRACDRAQQRFSAIGRHEEVAVESHIAVPVRISRKLQHVVDVGNQTGEIFSASANASR
jgi:hypothetical protein